MPNSLYQNVPEDIWRSIFTGLADDAGGSSRIVPLTTVCKQWKEMATPFLYRDLRFDSYEPLQACYLSILREQLQGRSPGRATETFICNAPLAWDQVATVERLLPYFISLVVFDVSETGLGTPAIAVLAHNCQRTLRVLALRLGNPARRTPEDIFQLALVGRFSRLHSLSLYIDSSMDVSSIAQPGSPYVFSMPVLAQLEIRSLAPVALTDVFSFFARGRYPVLKILVLDLLMESPRHMSATPLLSLLPLFENLGTSLEIVGIRLNPALETSRLLLPLLTRLRALEFQLGPIPEDLMAYLPPTVEILVLGFNPENLQEQRALTGHLEALLSRLETEKLRLTDVKLRSTTRVPFLWRNAAASQPTFAGSAMGLSMDLDANGIHLRDRDGTWLRGMSD